MSALIATSPAEQSVGLISWPSLDLAIPWRGEWQHTWFTLQTCEMAVQNCPARYKFIIVENGRGAEPLPSVAQEFLREFAANHPLDLVSVPEALSPPSARNMGAALGTGEYIFFFDSHVVPAHDYFSRAISQMAAKKLDMLHSSYRYGASDSRFHYQLDDSFWGTPEVYVPQDRNEPYRCAASGHGGFVVRRSVWEKLGGYWSDFRAYAGEEVYWDLKMWLTGHEVWIDPKLIHAHLPGARVYQRHYTAHYFINQMACANILGGEELARSKYRFLRRIPQAQPFDMMTLFREALDRSAAHAQELQSTFIRSYNEQLEWFAQNGIPF
jgi:hypothetical protein